VGFGSNLYGNFPLPSLYIWVIKMKDNNFGRGYWLIPGVNTIQAVMRILFAYIETIDMIKEFLTTPVTQQTMTIINTSSLILGLTGLISSFGLITKKKWGILSTTIISGATIIFDIWGVTIQSTASLGFLVPVITLVYFYIFRGRGNGE